MSYSDPSGELFNVIGGFGVRLVLTTLVRISFKAFMANRVWLALLVAGQAFTSDTPKQSSATSISNDATAIENLKKERLELQNRVISSSKGAALLFHYGDYAQVRAAFSTESIPASRGVPHLGFPVGAYSTTIPPWYSNPSFTQRKLAFAFYRNENRDVSNFVAFVKEPHFQPNPAGRAWNEYCAPATNPGDPVQIKPVATGPNLMLP